MYISLFNADKAELLLQRRYRSTLPRAVRQRSAAKSIPMILRNPCSAAINKTLPSPQPMSMKVARGIIFWQRRHHFGKRAQASFVPSLSGR
jgi:hypothetical protein